MTELKHDYDARKAHEYYLRTRELKGRRRGQAVTPVRRRRKAVRRVPVKPKKIVKTPEQKRREAEARVSQLKFKLEQLREILRRLNKEAKARSGVVEKKKPTHKPPVKSKTQLKSDHREASKKYYEKHKREIAAKKKQNQSLSQQAADLTEQIKKVQERIVKMRAKLSVSDGRDQRKHATHP